jgi:hypothetical protein
VLRCSILHTISQYINNTIFSRGDHFQFGLVFIKKNNETGFVFLKKLKSNQNRFKPTGFGQVILEKKPIQTDFAWFFSSLAWFFSSLGSIRFFQF